MTWLERISRVFLPLFWGGMLSWKFYDIWTWRGWWAFGLNLFLLALYAWGSVMYMKIALRNHRHVRIRPFPFPVPDVWPDLPEALNSAQKMVEETSGDEMPIYFIDVTYKPKGL